jgi:hypothetical protein
MLTVTNLYRYEFNLCMQFKRFKILITYINLLIVV